MVVIGIIVSVLLAAAVALLAVQLHHGRRAKRTIDALGGGLRDLEQSLRNEISLVRAGVTDELTKAHETLRTDAAAHRDAVSEEVKRVGTTLGAAIAQTERALADNMQDVQDAIHQDVERVGQTLGEQITGVHRDVTAEFEQTRQESTRHNAALIEQLKASMDRSSESTRQSSESMTQALGEIAGALRTFNETQTRRKHAATMVGASAVVAALALIVLSVIVVLQATGRRAPWIGAAQPSATPTKLASAGGEPAVPLVAAMPERHEEPARPRTDPLAPPRAPEPEPNRDVPAQRLGPLRAPIVTPDVVEVEPSVPPARPETEPPRSEPPTPAPLEAGSSTSAQAGTEPPRKQATPEPLPSPRPPIEEPRRMPHPSVSEQPGGPTPNTPPEPPANEAPRQASITPDNEPKADEPIEAGAPEKAPAPPVAASPAANEHEDESTVVPPVITPPTGEPSEQSAAAPEPTPEAASTPTREPEPSPEPVRTEQLAILPQAEPEPEPEPAPASSEAPTPPAATPVPTAARESAPPAPPPPLTQADIMQQVETATWAWGGFAEAGERQNPLTIDECAQRLDILARISRGEVADDVEAQLLRLAQARIRDSVVHSLESNLTDIQRALVAERSLIGTSQPTDRGVATRVATLEDDVARIATMIDSYLAALPRDTRTGASRAFYDVRRKQAQVATLAAAIAKQTSVAEADARP